MKLSTKGRYAVMAMVDLACHNKGEPMPLADIAIRQEISLSYLEQLFMHLRKRGLLKSVRGPGGGYLLSRPSREIRIADIIAAVDEPITMVRCKADSSIGCRRDKARCLTHDLWDELSQRIHLYLRSVSLQEVCKKEISSAGHGFVCDKKELKQAVAR